MEKRKEKEIKLISENVWGKKGVKKKNVINRPSENNINNVVEEHFFWENNFYSGIAVNLKWLNTINLFSDRQTNRSC